MTRAWDRQLTLAWVASRARAERTWAATTERARGRFDGAPVRPEDGVAWLAGRCVERTEDNYQALVVVTGGEGSSKSTFALRLLLACAATQAARGYRVRPWDFRRLTYSASEIIGLWEAAAGTTELRGAGIWYDEGIRGLLAGETFDPEQRALVKALTVVRELGSILVVCLPDIHELARKVRIRRAHFWVHVESRGTRRKPAPSVARVHEKDERLRYEDDDSLPLVRSAACPTLEYGPFHEDDPLWAAYERVKGERMRSFMADIRRELAVAKARSLGQRRGAEP